MVRKLVRKGMSCLVMLAMLTASVLAGAIPAQAQGGSGTTLAWHWLNPLPQGNSLAGVAYGNGLYVAVGAGGTILTSSTGSTWQTVASGTQDALTAVTYGGGSFVAVGQGGAILLSSDGKSWSLVTAPTSADLSAVAYGGGQYMAVGASGTVLVSADGVQWTAETSGTTEDLYGVGYGNGTWVAAGEGGENTQTGAYFTTLLSSSDNGSTWTASSFNADGADLYGVAYASGQFVVVGDSGFGSAATILTSPDGSVWTAQTSGVSGSLDAVGYAPGLAGLLAVGSSGQMLTSADGVTWRTVASGTQQSLAGLACGSTSCVAIGIDGTIVLGSSAQAWTPAAMAAPYSFYPSAVTFGDGLLVSVGQDSNGNAAVMTSSDGGANWQAATVPQAASAALNAVTYAGGLFVAVGGNGIILTSTNGTAWTAANSPVAGTSQSNNDLTTVTYGDGLFVAFSSGGVALTSADGVNWTLDTAGESAAAGNSVFAATYDPNSGTFVAVESGANVLTSSNGTAWSARPLADTTWQLNDAAYGNGVFVAVGYLAVAGGGRLALTSSDGTSWTQVAPPAGTGSLTWVTFVSGQGFYASDGTALYASADGTTWTALPAFSGSVGLDGAAWNGSGLVVVGNFLPNAGGIAWRYGSTLAFASVSTAVTTDNLRLATSGGGVTVAVGASTIPSNFNDLAVLVPVFASTGGPWTQTTLTLPSVNEDRSVASVTYGPAGFVGVGNKTIVTSTDGSNWTVTRSVYDLTNVAYGDGEYLADGVDPTTFASVVATSATGTAWTVTPAPFGLDTYGPIAFGDGMFVVAAFNGNSGATQIFTSANGIHWTAGVTVPSPFAGVSMAYGNGRFMLVGNGNSLDGTPPGFTSTDGTTWTSANLPGDNSIGYSAVAYGGGAFLAVGDFGDAAVSTDGSNWTAIAPVAANGLVGVTYTGSAFVAVGLGGAILESGTAALPPTIASLVPSSGPPRAPLVITGTGFGTVAGAVYFTPSGGAPLAAGITSWSDTSVGARVPATLGPGTVSVTVYNAADGLASSPALFTVTTAPLLASATPARGAIGSSLTLTGSGFGGAPGTVVFTEGAVSVTQTAVTSWNPTQVAVAVPSGLTPGSLQVVVRTASGQQSNPLPFTLTGPVLQSLTPSAGAPNSTLTLAGTGFGTVAGAVYFQGSLKTAVQTAVQSWSDSQVITTVPGVTPGTVQVAVYNPATGLSNSLPFQLGSAKSSVTVLQWQPDPIAAPGSLQAGAQVTLTVAATDKNGQAISGAAIYLSLQAATGGGSATVGGTTLTAMPEPFTADSSGDVAVTYTAPSTLPASGVDEIIAQNAASAPTATATDSYAFAPVASYSFSPSPVAATGSLAAGSSTTVTLTALDSKGAPLAAAPVYLALLPASGGGSASVDGTSVGSTPALFTTRSDGTLSITYAAPATLPQGGQDILVAQNAATAPSLSATDRYTFAPVLPVVTAVSPSYDSSTPNTPVPPVTITGTGFTGATAVYFGPYQAPDFQVVSDRRIIVQVPRCDAFCYQSGDDFAFDGTSVNIRVENPTGKSLRSFADLYTFDAGGPCGGVANCPTVTAVTPDQGPMQGGTTVTAYSPNLIGHSGTIYVNFGPSEQGNGSYGSVSSLTGPSPAGCGTQFVTMGGLPEPGAAFTYTGEPVVTGITPVTAAPGSVVTVTGQNLAPPPGGDITVYFGPYSAGDLNSGVRVVSPTELRVPVPEGSGSAYVRVQVMGTSQAMTNPFDPDEPLFRCWSTPTAAGLFTYQSVPVVQALAPSSGPASGGTAVTITGHGFAGATRVSFGGTTAASLTVVNDSEITAVAPPGSGSVDVMVTAPGGTSAASPADRFTYAGPVSCTGSGSVSASGGTVGCGSVGTLAVPRGATSGSIEIVLSPSALQQLASSGDNPQNSPAGQQLFQALQAAQQAGSGAVLAVNGQQVTVPSSFSPQSFAAFVGQLGSALGLPSSVTQHWTAGMQAAFDIGSGQGAASDLYSMQSAMDWLTSNLGLPPSAVDPQGTLAYVENGDRDAWLFGAPPQSASPADPWYQMWQNALVNAAANGCDAGCQQAVFFGPGIDGSLSFQNTGLCQGVQCYDQAVQNDLQRVWWIENTPGNACLLSASGCGGDPPPAGDPPQDPPTVAEGLSTAALPLAVAPDLLPPLGTGIQVQLGEGATLAKPATLTLTFDPSQVPPGDAVAVYTFSGGGFTALPTTVAGNQASAPITASGTYGVLPAPAHAPLVLGVSPTSGAAGTSVTLTGSGFTGATALAFGSAAAASFQVVSDSEITAAVPPGAGTVAVTVTTLAGKSPLSALSAFTYGSVPSGPALSLTATPQATVTGQSVLVQATLTGAASLAGATVQFTTTGGMLSAASAVTGGDGAASTLLSDGTPETDRVTATATLSGSTTLSATVDIPFVTAPSTPTTVVSAVYGDLPPIGAPISLTGSTSGSSVDLTNSVLPGLDVMLDAGSSAAAAAVAGSVSATVYSTASALQLLAGTPALAVVGTSPSAPTSATFVGPVVQFSLSGTAAQLFGEDSATQDTGALVVTMPYDASAVPAGGTPEVVWLDPSGQWTDAGVIVLGWGGGLVTALLPHLSTYTVVAVQGGVATSESLAASASNATLGGSVAVTATVKDQAGAAMAGVPVSFATTLGSMSPATAVTNGNGQASATLTSAQAGTATVTAAVSGISPPSTVQVGFSAVANSGGGGGGGYAPSVPAVTAISPTGGPAAGGTQVTITGTNFAAPATVNFGPNAATGVTVESATEIVAISPAGTGTVDVTVTTSAGTSATDTADQFAYASAPAVSFSDVTPSYWAYSAIEALVAKGIINGFPDGTFRPHASVTRAQFVKMLDLTLGLKPGTPGTSFTDVPASAWYAPYVAAAVQAGIVSGLSPTTFGPNETLTREQMAVLLARALKLSQAVPLHFTDDAAIDAWAMQGVEETVAAGYMNGFPNGSFQPAGATTRAQAAKVLAMVLRHAAG